MGGLRAFHLFFIALSVVMAAFTAAWAVGEYRTGHEVAYVIGGTLSLLSGVLLAVYGAAFQRKTRQL